MQETLDPDLSLADRETILMRAALAGELLDFLALRNCNYADLQALRSMIQDKIASLIELKTTLEAIDLQLKVESDKRKLEYEALLKQRADEIFMDSELRESKFAIYIRLDAIMPSGELGSGQVFSLCEQIKNALLSLSPINVAGENLFDEFVVSIGVEDGVDFQSGQLTIRIDACKSIEENISLILRALESGKPKEIREIMCISSESPEQTLAYQIIDKRWLIWNLQKSAQWPHLSGFVILGDRNIAPTEDSWGYMMVDLKDEDGNVSRFILENIANIRKIDEEIREKIAAIKDISLALGFELDFMPYRLLCKGLTPNRFFAKVEKLLECIKVFGSFLSQDGKILQVYFGEEYGVARFEVSDGCEIIAITCRIDYGVLENFYHIYAEAKKAGVSFYTTE